MRTPVDLPEPPIQNAKVPASERGTTLYTVRGRLVNPRLDLDRISALEIDDDEAEYGGRSDG